MMNWLISRIKSFGYAFEGIGTLFKDEPNAKIHLAAAIVVISLGGYFEIEKSEWIVLIICIGSVFTAELINTAIENLSDAITTENNPIIKKAKDVAAGAVLAISMTSAIIGVLIFWPYLKALIY